MIDCAVNVDGELIYYVKLEIESGGGSGSVT